MEKQQSNLAAAKLIDTLPFSATFYGSYTNPGLTTIQKHGNHRKSHMVTYENIRVMESSIEVYGDMQIIKRPYYSMIPCKSYTVP